MGCKIYFSKPPQEARRLRVIPFDLEVTVKGKLNRNLEEELARELVEAYDNQRYQTGWEDLEGSDIKRKAVYENITYEKGYVPKLSVNTDNIKDNSDGSKTYKVKGIIQFPLEGRVYGQIPKTLVREEEQQSNPQPWYKFWKSWGEIKAERQKQE